MANQSFSAWDIQTTGLHNLLSKCDPSDEVWQGADGSIYVGPLSSELAESDTEYEYAGTVAEYLEG